MRANGGCTKYGIATRAEGGKHCNRNEFCTNNDMEAKLHQFEVFKVEPKYGFAD